LKLGVVVARVVAHVAAWDLTTDQKAVHTLNVDWQLLPAINFASVLAVQAAVIHNVAESVDTLVGFSVKATVQT
jgi:hypothetical protein